MFTPSLYTELDDSRREVSRNLDPKKRSELGQFMTPNSIASFMSSLFTFNKNIKLIDPGAGIGSLTSAFLEQAIKNNSYVDAELWEIDSSLLPYLESTINYWKHKGKGNIIYTIHNEDFIDYATFQLEMGGNKKFTHVILNPPYKKINSKSKYRHLLSDVGIETVNLYSAFVSVCIELLAENGELVAILPRSFCNGTYYRPFRELILDKTFIKHLHLFKSRNRAFREDDVLQENIIIHLVKGAHFKNVIVSTSFDSEFDDYREHIFRYSSIVDKNSKNKFIHIPSNGLEQKAPGICTHSLEEIKLEVSTGQIVDFRNKEYLQKNIKKDSIPLLYPFNFSEGKLIWPKEHKKPNALKMSSDLKKNLMPKGNYVLVKRFSSKEEKKRIVAFFLSSDDLNYEYVGIENHLNVFHFFKQGINEYLARGLTVFLNSTIIDNYFRVFSGHTQVNATDLRAIKYPSKNKLIEIGKKSVIMPTDQIIIDKLIKEI